MIFKLDESNKLSPPLYAAVEKGKFTRPISRALLYYLASYKESGQIGIRRDHGIPYIFLHPNDQDIHCIGWTWDFELYFELHNIHESDRNSREQQSKFIMASKLANYHRRRLNVNRHFMGNPDTHHWDSVYHIDYNGGISIESHSQ